MNMSPETYRKYAAAHAPRSPILKNGILAFLVGGSICALGQALCDLFLYLGLDTEGAGCMTSIALIFLAVLLTVLGIFDKLAKHAGAGTLVPITGFANAVVSPAIDSRAEGLVLGVGAKIFTVAGPVLLYGTLAGALYGVIEWLLSL